MQEKRRKGWLNPLNASLTVEASLILPVLVFAIAGLLTLIQILNIQQKLQFAMSMTAWEASEYGFVYNDLLNGEEENAKETPSVIRQLADGTFYSLAMAKYVDRDWIERSCILGGYKGLSFYGSSFMEDGEGIKIALSYRVRIPFPIFSFISFPIRQQVCSRAFIGDGLPKEPPLENEGKGEEEKEDYVYITETGSKYHMSEECTHLKLSISCISADELPDKRNSSGAKYYACEKCSRDAPPEILYITREGNRYHWSLSCSGLKRTVTAVPLKEAQGMGNTPCMKCGKK